MEQQDQLPPPISAFAKLFFITFLFPKASSTLGEIDYRDICLLHQTQPKTAPGNALYGGNFTIKFWLNIYREIHFSLKQSVNQLQSRI